MSGDWSQTSRLSKKRVSAGRDEGNEPAEEKVTPADSEGCLVAKEVASAGAGDCVMNGMESGQSVSGKDGMKDMESESVGKDLEREPVVNKEAESEPDYEDAESDVPECETEKCSENCSEND